MEILDSKVIENMASDERVQYFAKVKEFCLNQKNAKQRNNKLIRAIMGRVSPVVRTYDFEIVGKENIPTDGNVLFVANHSNVHDFYTMQETFSSLGIAQTFLASNECINAFIQFVFESCGGVLFNRSDKGAAKQALLDFTTNIVKGMPGIIYPEATWNLHPYKPMHLIKPGAVIVSAIADAKIVPLIFEYIEVPKCCTKENKIYDKCVVAFFPPVEITGSNSIFAQTDMLQRTLEQSRTELWHTLGINKDIHSINQEVYLNHTYLKKFGGTIEYNAEQELHFLRAKDQLSAENEYHLDENGVFCPGTLTREEGKRYIEHS